MKSILILALKDLKLQSRDWFGLFWILVFPLMLALFIGAMFSGSGPGNTKAISLGVIDEVQSKASKDFLDRLGKSNALDLKAMPLEEARAAVMKGKKVAYLVVKSGFGDQGMFFGGDPKRLELGIDPKQRADVELIKGLIMEAVFADFKDMFADPAKGRAQMKQAMKGIEKSLELDDAAKGLFRWFFGVVDQFLEKMPAAIGKEKGDGKGGFNIVDLDIKDTATQDEGPHSPFEITFPSSILWAMIGCVAAFSISLVVERREGTFLRLRTAPLSLIQLLAGKGLACFFMCCGATVLLLAFATLALGARLGNVALLALAIVCTSLCFTGIMMFVSTLGRTEQSVAGAGWGIMMPLAMLGGGMIPLIAMPPWMLTASHFSPVKWGIYALEGAIWRRFTFVEMLLPCAILLAIGAVGFSIGVMWLKKQEGA